MKHTYAALILSALTLTSIAQADPNVVPSESSSLPTAWPTSTQAAMASPPETPPPNGTMLLYPGLAMSAVGAGTSAYAMYLGTHSDKLTLSYGLLIGGSTVALTGSILSFVAMVQGIRYAAWMERHPVVRSLAIGPGAVGYLVVF